MRRAWFFLFFVVSGGCSLVYQVVWLRLAMAEFGVTTAMVSIVLSVFMAGLALGSWGAGALAARLAGRPSLPLRLYAAAELVIATSAQIVPTALGSGRTWLASYQEAEWGSANYHAAASACVAAALLPFCVAMGATVPLAMAAIRDGAPDHSSDAFSYLYVANVLGAALGTLVSAFALIELLGFRGTLHLAAALNAGLAAAALLLSLGHARGGSPYSTPASAPPNEGAAALRAGLFLTGLTCMAAEIVWVRQFTPYMGTVVYAFAMILSLYLLATLAGSQLYRRTLASRTDVGAVAGLAWALVGALALVPLAAADPRLPLAAGVSLSSGALRVALGTVPFNAALGFLTPMLVDRLSGGEPARAGSGYAVNVLGCILGPLLSGFVLLPRLGERGTLLVLSLPFFAYAAGVARVGRPRLLLGAGLAACLALSSRSYEGQFRDFELRRDSTATVLAVGRGMQRQLLVNGVGMTKLTPITKMMAHLPLAFLARPASRVLIICFGMGTSFRSALAWGVDTTAVELVPSIPRLMEYFHADAEQLLAEPRARVVIDDGRRFLERSRARFDVIVVDPPPPVEAAGSSLLYSRQFYALAAQRLSPSGILQAWIPMSRGEPALIAFVRALQESFPFVRGYLSVEGWGVHVLASQVPLSTPSATELARRLPDAAARDLIEWGPAADAEGEFALVLSHEIDLAALVARGPGIPALSDDHPVNEYYFLRRTLARWTAAPGGVRNPDAF